MPFLRAALIKPGGGRSGLSAVVVGMPPQVAPVDIIEIIEPEVETKPVEEIVPEAVETPESESESEIVPDADESQESESESESEIVPDADESEIIPDVDVVEETPSPQEPEPKPEPEPEHEHEKPHKDYSGETLDYDFTAGKRYVDSVSTKTEFDKMLDELADISKDLLSWQVDKFARQHTSKFQGDFDKSEADAKKYEAFLGGYITNAAMTLYDNGYSDIAIKQLDQAKSILEARKKLEEETLAIKTRVEEDNDAVDLTDLLSMFGD